MANIFNPATKARRIKWHEGDRVTGKYTMPVNEYGEWLARSGKRHQNILKRKHQAKAFCN